MHDLLAARMLAKQEHRRPRCWGISSDALALYGVGIGERPQVPGTPEAESAGGYWMSGDECGRMYPFDPSDLLACELTYEMANTAERRRMYPVLVEFRAWVLDGINRHGKKVQAKGYRGRVEPQGVSVPEAWGDCAAS